MTRRATGAAALAVWCLIIAACIWWQAKKEWTPGEAGAAPVRLSADGLGLGVGGSGRPLVVLALHPRCPCSRASLTEFGAIVRDEGTTADVVILLGAPDDADGAWLASDVARRAATAAEAIPGARVVLDKGGRIGSRLGLRTSGHVLVYDADGRLAYSGGVTRSRGMLGPSGGGRAMRRALHAPGTVTGIEASGAPVYGCALVGAPGSVEP